ncbi:MAG: hypothetical protein JO199_07325 [Candidatus Eremiobacteraeota bacterium]|nr:hypothetical protein [Candidatus Eremiobacteraeota bacterium]
MNARMLSWVAAAFLLPAAVSASMPQRGNFALQGGTPKADAYLEAAGSDGSWKLAFWLTQWNTTKLVRAYDLDMTKPMHAIVVSNDFKTFVHDHPAFASSSGHFTMSTQLPAGTYQIYFDGRPKQLGQQVFRFTLPEGASPDAQRDLSERRTVAQADGYTVTISSLSLEPTQDTALTIHIAKNGKAATDLHPYLGMLGHAVFIDAGDLSYVHVHPVTGATTQTETYQSDTATIPSDMVVHVTVDRPGTYKMWFQFNGGASTHVASFVLTAKGS